MQIKGEPIIIDSPYLSFYKKFAIFGGGQAPKLQVSQKPLYQLASFIVSIFFLNTSLESVMLNSYKISKGTITRISETKSGGEMITEIIIKTK
jgi:hypothetical protein